MVGVVPVVLVLVMQFWGESDDKEIALNSEGLTHGGQGAPSSK